MKLIVDQRRSGKTQRLIEWAAENPKRIICAISEKDRQCIILRLEQYSTQISHSRAVSQVYTFKYLLDHRSLFAGSEIAIDELQMGLGYLFGGSLVLATMTCNTESVINDERLEEIRVKLEKLLV